MTYWEDVSWLLIVVRELQNPPLCYCVNCKTLRKQTAEGFRLHLKLNLVEVRSSDASDLAVTLYMLQVGP